MSSEHSRTTDSLAGTPLPDTADQPWLTVRELLRELARLEDELQALRRTAAERTGPILDPKHQQLLMLERAVIRQLRSRKSRVRSSVPAPGRQPSAAWPAPPWN